MLTVEQAKAKILEGAEAVAEVEDMVTLYSAGKILAEDIVSEIKVPPLDNSQMDGYAVRCADFAGGRRNFPVSQRIFAGHVGTELEPGTVARIFTGAPIPPGADAVIPQEEASEMEDGSVEFHCEPKAGAWIRRAGCDIDIGQTVLKRGDRLTPRRSALLRASAFPQLRFIVRFVFRFSSPATNSRCREKSSSRAASITPTVLSCAVCSISWAAMWWITAIFPIRLKQL